MVVVYRKLKRNACQETDNYNRSGNRVLFLSAHSYTFVSPRSIFLAPPFSRSLSFTSPSFFDASHCDKLAGVLLAHSSTIHSLFTSRNKPSFLLRHALSQPSISSITPRYPCIYLVPACSQLVSKLVLSRHHVLSQYLQSATQSQSYELWRCSHISSPRT